MFTDTCHLLAERFRALGRVGLVLLRFGTSHNTLQLVKTPQFHISVILNVKKIFESVQNKTNSFYQNVSLGNSSAARCLLLEPMPCVTTERDVTRINDRTRKSLAGNESILRLQSGLIKKGRNWTSQDTLIKSSVTSLSLVTMH